MANTAKGHATLKAGDAEFTLAFTLNALCEIEDRLDCPVSKIGERLADVSAKDMRVILWAGLQEFHSDEISDESAAGNLCTLQQGIEAIKSAFEAAFPPESGGGKPVKRTPK